MFTERWGWGSCLRVVVVHLADVCPVLVFVRSPRVLIALHTSLGHVPNPYSNCYLGSSESLGPRELSNSGSSPFVLCSSVGQQPVLPPFDPLVTSPFTWGSVDCDTFSEKLHCIYSKVLHWRRNCFKVPVCNVGRKVVSELSRLFTSFASQSATESVALMATIVMPLLLLQKPSRSSNQRSILLA